MLAVAIAAITLLGDDVRRLPVQFVENRGQWHPSIALAARGSDVAALVRPDGFVLRATASTAVRRSCDGEDAAVVAASWLDLAFVVEDASPVARALGRRATPTLHHFLLGRDRARWRTGASGFEQAIVAGVRPGVDLVLRHGAEGFVYDLELAPGARVEGLVLRCDGAEGLALERDGGLRVTTAAGVLRQTPPRAWITRADGSRRDLPVSFRLLGERRFGFTAPELGGDESLTIDPGLEWSTFFGGADADRAFDLATDDHGVVTIAGRGLSSDLPATTGAYDEDYNGTATTPQPVGDVWVARFTADGAALQWCTYLGGSDNDHAAEVLLAADGDAIVSGWTASDDFPTTVGCYDDSYNGNGSGLFLGGDVFVTRIESDGSDLAASTYLGGSDLEYTIGMALGADESVYVSGHVHSRDFPTTSGAYQETTTDHSEVFLSRVSADGTTLIASTFFGGDAEEYTHGLAVTADGAVIAAGGTNSTNMPVTAGVVDAIYDGGDTSSHLVEGFVVRFTADLSAIDWMTYLGRGATDAIVALQLAPDGDVIVSGETRSADFPATAGAWQTAHGGGFDGFVARLSSDATVLEWCTFVGGEADDRVEGLQLEPSGNVVFGGRTASTLFATTAGAYDVALAGGADAFVVRLARDGSRAHYSSYVGGTSFDIAHEVVTHGTGAATLAGETFSSAFPTTTGAYDTTYNKLGDAYVTRLDLLPAGVARHGTSTPGCTGALAIGIDRQPQAGADFALTCEDGPTGGSGWLGLAFGRLDPPLAIAGIDLHLDPASGLFLLIPVTADATGYGEMLFHSGPGLAGLVFVAQWFWQDPCGPQGITATPALEATIQP